MFASFTYPLSEEDTIEKEQIAQLEETIQVAEEFLNSLDLENMENKKQKETIKSIMNSTSIIAFHTAFKRIIN